jgi:hypothetical protein
MFDKNTKLTAAQRNEYQNLIALGGQEIIVQRKNEGKLEDEKVKVRIVTSLKEFMRAYEAFEDTEDPFFIARFFCVRPEAETPEERETWIDSLIPESIALIEEVARELNFTNVCRYAEPRVKKSQERALANIERMMKVVPPEIRGQVLEGSTQASQGSSDALAEKLLKDAGLSKPV